jgi:RND family efflux transporter MFP subunit
MNESTGTATRSQGAAVFPKLNGRELEGGKPIAIASVLQHSRSGGRTALTLGPGPRRVAMGAAAAVVLLTGAGFAVMASSEGVETPRAPRVLAVQVVSVELVSAYRVARSYTGAIVARRTSQLGFELAGKLNEIYVDEGDSITVGTALAMLDTEHLQTNRRLMIARRAQAAAKLDELIAGPRDEDIAAAGARVESLEAQVELLTLRTARHKKLVVSSATSQDEYEQHAFGLKARQAELNEAQHGLRLLINGTRTEQIEAGQAVVDELDAAIADIDVDLGKSTLTAPFSGTIARRLSDDGTVVELGQPIFKLVEDQALEAWIGLPVHATQQLANESAQRIKIGGQLFDATVKGLLPEVDLATRTRTVILGLAGSAAGDVVHGQVARLQLDETVEANGYWLPSTALTKGVRGLWTCFVVVNATRNDSVEREEFRVERRDVEVMHTESNRVLVRGTLNSADRVISSGTHRVVPGQLVRLTK